ncbi:hypothetical protein SAMN05519103_03411 [Rhizobiales bacterium GAS113]|nr:hypothetical protein SAMN05519103_03411 [Rhizobiales bacterium GAS113]
MINKNLFFSGPIALAMRGSFAAKYVGGVAMKTSTAR